MAWGALITGIIVAGLSTGLQLLLQPAPPKQKIGGDAPNVPKSDYGKGIPLIYGRFKVSTNWIFPSKSDVLFRKEVSTESVGGGKGGGRQQVEKTEYFATFACLICEGPVELEAIYLNDNRYNPDSDVFQKYCTFFDGTQTQPWSVIQNKDDQPENEIIYKDLAYIGFEDLPENYFDYKVDALVNSVNFPADPDLGDVVFDLCYRMIKHQVDQGKLPESDLLNLASKIDVSELNNTQIKKGFFVERSSEGYREALQSLATLYLFTVIELKNGNLKFKLFQRPQNETVLHIPAEHFFPIEEGDNYNIYTRKPSPKEDQGLPSKIIFKYFHEPRYIEDQVTEFFPFGEENNILNLSAPLGTYPYHARELVFNQQKFLAVWQKAIYEIIIPAFYYEQIDLLSLLQLPNGEIVQIYDVSSGNDYLLRITASSYGGNLSLEYSGIEDGVGQDNNYTSPVIPAVYILDIRQIEDYPPSTLYVLATTANTLRISLDGGITTNATVNHLAPSTIGNCLTPLPNNGGGLDVVNYLDIELESGFVEGISQEQFDNPNLFNLALLAIQQPDGYYNGKFIQFRDVQALGNNQYRLSYIFQGWYDSQFFDTSSLPLKFFLLKGNGAYYSVITGNPQLIGQPITVTPIVSPAQDIGTTPTTVFTPSGNSYQPPAVTNLQAQEDGEGNIRLTWEYSPTVSAYQSQTSLEDVTFDVVIGNDIRTIAVTKTQVIYLIGDRTFDAVTKPFLATVYAVNNVFGRGIPTAITVNTTPIADTVFGTGEGGFKGIKTITNNATPPTQFTYTATEDDNGWILKVINPNATYTDLEFGSNLSNGFTCQVIADGTSSDLNSRVRFIVDNLLQPDDNLDILAGSTVEIAHAGSGNYSILGNNRKFLQVHGDNSIQVRKTWNFTGKNYNTPTQSIGIDYDEDFGDRSNLRFFIIDAYIESLISASATISNLQSLIDGLELLITDIQADITSLTSQTNTNTTNITNLTNQINNLVIPTNETIQDMLSSFLVAGSNITLTYNDVANSLTISSTGGGGAGGSGNSSALAQYYAQGNLPNTDRVEIVLNKAVQSIKVYNGGLTEQDIRIASIVDGETLTQLAYLLPSEETINFKYKYPVNYIGANDGLAIECSSGNVNYFCEYSDVNTDILIQGSVAVTTQTAIYTATQSVNIPLFLLINADVVQPSQTITLFINKGGIITREKITLLSGQTIDISPDYSINLSTGNSILLQCSVGTVSYFFVTVVE